MESVADTYQSSISESVNSILNGKRHLRNRRKDITGILEGIDVSKSDADTLRELYSAKQSLIEKAGSNYMKSVQSSNVDRDGLYSLVDIIDSKMEEISEIVGFGGRNQKIRRPVVSERHVQYVDVESEDSDNSGRKKIGKTTAYIAAMLLGVGGIASCVSPERIHSADVSPSRDFGNGALLGSGSAIGGYNFYLKTEMDRIAGEIAKRDEERQAFDSSLMDRFIEDVVVDYTEETAGIEFGDSSERLNNFLGFNGVEGLTGIVEGSVDPIEVERMNVPEVGYELEVSETAGVRANFPDLSFSARSSTIRLPVANNVMGIGIPASVTATYDANIGDYRIKNRVTGSFAFSSSENIAGAVPVLDIVLPEMSEESLEFEVVDNAELDMAREFSEDDAKGYTPIYVSTPEGRVRISWDEHDRRNADRLSKKSVGTELQEINSVLDM